MKSALKIGAVLAAVVLILVLFPVGDWVESAADWAQSLGPIGILAFAAIYAFATVFAVPGSALTLLAGGAFGVALGTVAVWIGATAGLMLAFIAARRLARDRVNRWLEQRPTFAAVDRAVAKEGWKIVFLTRLTPVFPFTFLNYAYGLTGVRFWPYALASSIGILPGSLFYIYIGSSVASAVGSDREAGELALRVGGFVAFALVTVLITRIARRALRDAGVSDAEETQAMDASGESGAKP